MIVDFANPAGLWALLAVPAVIAIHFLQRRSRRLVVTTRFLLEAVPPLSASGRRFERLRNSLTLWLQLLAALLAAWLLCEPRWVRPESRQTIVVVLDSSLSMEASKDRLVPALSRSLGPLANSAAATEWIAIPSDPSLPRIYSGSSLEELFARLDNWQPGLGSHSPDGALRLARNLAGSNGLAVFVSDRELTLPDGIAWVGIGQSIENTGWIGLGADSDGWTALLRNHGVKPVSTSWHVEVPGTDSLVQNPIELSPGETRAISGTFPNDSDALTLVLQSDAFSIDDRLPIVRPDPKLLRVGWEDGGNLADFFDRLASSLENVSTVGSAGADLRFVEHSLLAPSRTGGPAAIFVTDPTPAEKLIPGMIVAEDHPLSSDLAWQGLVARETFGLKPGEADEVLVWQGSRALIFLRGSSRAPTLVVNFDLQQSNADRLPAFVILLERFVSSIREQTPGFERANFELGQDLNLAQVDPGVEVSGIENGPVLRAPPRPGMFSVSENGGPLLIGAAHFADAREADFQHATSGESVGRLSAKLLEAHTETDFLRTFWMLLLGATLIASWAAVGREQT